MKSIILVLFLISPAVFAKTPVSRELKAQPQKGQVMFEAVGKPSFLKIKGQGEGPEGRINIGSTVSGQFKFKLQSLSTGIALRDQHMKEKYLQLDKYPTAEIKIASVENFDPNSLQAEGLPFQGTLTVHGVEKPVKGTVDIKKIDMGYKVSAKFDAKISDHAIDVPSYTGITVADQVKVSVETELL